MGSIDKQPQDDPTLSYYTVEQLVNQVRLTLVPTSTTVSGTVRNRLITSYYMTQTMVPVRTSVPVRQNDRSQSSRVSPSVIAVAIIIPLVVLSLLVLFILVRRRRRQRQFDHTPAPYLVYKQNAQPNILVGRPVSTTMDVATTGTVGSGLDVSDSARREKMSLAFPERSRSQDRNHDAERGAAPPNYEAALTRTPTDGTMPYAASMSSSTSLLVRRPSVPQREYPSVDTFLAYLSMVPGGKQRNLSQYAPTFRAQDYYTINDLRSLTQAQLCEAIPGLTRGNGDFIVSMVRAELVRIDAEEPVDKNSISSQRAARTRSAL